MKKENRKDGSEYALYPAAPRQHRGFRYFRRALKSLRFAIVKSELNRISSQVAAKPTLAESFRADRSVAVTIDGGYVCTFAAKSGTTTIKGAPVIFKGTVHMKNFRISN